ncbi:hypothetical protein N7535_002112 [Penicillium sp. DV-2018c]|nr:hypothetical protein N7535_002112 [Penicillium sp. DV-2018c]
MVITKISLRHPGVRCFRKAGMRGYGNWYRMTNGRSCDVSPQDVIGRCYDPASAEVLFGTRDLASRLRPLRRGGGS